MKPTYKPKELNCKNNSQEEDIRVKGIFDTLVKKIESKQYVSELEINFVGMCLNFPSCKGVKISGFDEINSYKFKYLFLVYFHNLTGKGVYRKIKNKEVSTDKSTEYRPEKREIDSDLLYLKKQAILWERIINTNQTDELLADTIEETKKQFEFLDKSESNDPFFKTRPQYVEKKLSLILFTKYVYYVISEMFESYDNAMPIFEFNKEKIEITSFSMVHILIRHYGKAMKKWNTGKSHHTIDFKPREIITDTQEIMRKIDGSKLFESTASQTVDFNYLGKDYRIVIKEATKGQDVYKRLTTFFPIDKPSILQKLQLDYTKTRLESNLYVYVPITTQVI